MGIRSGLRECEYAWEDIFMTEGGRMANIWSGEFPFQGDEDGWCFGISSEGDFPANGYGLFDMIGNVWE